MAGVRGAGTEGKRGETRCHLRGGKGPFFEKGLQGTTMEQIAEAAELSKGSLYLYFPSKEELCVSILVEGLEILSHEFSKAIEGTEGWEQKLRNIALAYYRFYREHKNYFNILFLLHHAELASHLSDELPQKCFEKGTSCLNFLSESQQLIPPITFSCSYFHFGKAG